MSKFIQIAVNASQIFALDYKGTVWMARLDQQNQTFMEWHRSIEEPSDVEPKKEKTKKAEQPFHEWFNEIKQNEAYRGIDCNKELGKMKAWILLPKNKNRKLTKRFVLNWLNKVEPEIEAEVRTCPNRVRKEGSPFMKECGEPAILTYNGKLYCKKCTDELTRRLGSI